jgi:hypothetical protein
MLSFDYHTRQGNQRTTIEPVALTVAGWTGRDEAALHDHIEESAAIGAPHLPPFRYFTATAFLISLRRRGLKFRASFAQGHRCWCASDIMASQLKPTSDRGPRIGRVREICLCVYSS